MADIRLRIEVNPNAETETLGDIINESAELSNVSFKTDSDGKYTDYSNTNEYGREMLSWANNGVLKFNSEGLLSTDGVVAGALASETDPDMFVWGAVPENKQYSVKLTFSNATSLKDIVVYGDKTAYQFPTKAIIDGTKTIYSDDYQWAINMETESDTHTIEFVEWNRANYNACLTRIMVMLRYFDLDKGWIDSVESLTQSTTDPSSIQYGVLANSGSAMIRDLDGELGTYIHDGIISYSNVAIKVFANGNQIQEHLTGDCSYNNTTKELSISMSNKIQALGKLKYAGYQYQGKPVSLYELLEDVMSGITTQTLNEIITSDNITEVLKGITIPYPSIKYGETYGTVLDWICTISQTNIVCDANNNYKMFSARPVFFPSEKIISIPRHLCIGEPSGDLIIKNKFDCVALEAVKPITDDYYEIYTSDTLYVYDGNTYIAQNAGINPPMYTISKDEPFTGVGCVCFAFDYNIGDIAEVTDKNTIDDISVEVSVLEHNYTLAVNILGLKNASEIIDNGTSTKTQVVKSTSYIADSTLRAIIEKTADPNILHFRILIPVGGLIGEAYPNGSFPYSYVQSFDFRIRKKVVSFESISASTEDIDNCKTVATIGGCGSLLQVGSKYNGIEITDVIKQRVLSDYATGIGCGKVDLFVADCYYSDGSRAKEWRNGEMLDLGDLVQLDGSNSIYRITGRSFNYAGSPMLKIEYQEQKYEKPSYLSFEYDEPTDGYKLVGVAEEYSPLDGELKIPTSYMDDGTYGLKPVTVIGSNVLGDANHINQNVTSVVIPNSVTIIEEEAFRYCSKMTSVYIGRSVTVIGDYAFAQTSLTNITIPRNVSLCGTQVFAYCENLKEVVFETGSQLQATGWGMFYNCYNLQGVIIPSNIMILNGTTFANCSSLKSVIFEEGSRLDTIRQQAFFNCRALRDIIIPESVSAIDDNVFYNCSLSTITALAITPPRVPSDIFANATISKIFVPQESVGAYKTAFGWENYANKIEGL